MEFIFSLCRFSSGVIAVVLREENMLTLEMYTMYKIERIKSYLDINTSVLVICADKLYFEVHFVFAKKIMFSIIKGKRQKKIKKNKDNSLTYDIKV